MTRTTIIPEGQIVPYQVSSLPPGPWIVFAPHADDETFGMGGTLRRAAREGIATRLVVMTDGGLGGKDYDLVATREREARAAAEYLGINEVVFLAQPDRGLQLGDAQTDTLMEQIRGSGARTVFFPGVFEPHPDHRLTAELVWRALGRIADSDIRPAAYEITVQSPVNCLIDISDWISDKQQAMSLYKSQLGENNYTDIVLSLDWARTYTLQNIDYAEGFYLYDGADPARTTLREFTLKVISRLFVNVME